MNGSLMLIGHNILEADEKEGILKMQVPITGTCIFWLDFRYVLCFGSFRAINNFKADCLTFGQRLKPIPLDSGIMNKHVSALLLGNESKTFGLVEPFNGPFYHNCHTSLIIKNRRLRNNGISATKSKVLEAVYDYTSETSQIVLHRIKKKVKNFAPGVDRNVSFWVVY